MYEPDREICQEFVGSTNHAELNEVESVVVFKSVAHFRLCPHFAKQNYVALVDVRTDEDKRSSGTGSEMLAEVVIFLDWKKLTCVVHPESYGKNKNNRKLRAWYKRHGFNAMKGQATMIRKARK